MNWEEEITQIKNTIKDIEILHKKPNWEKPRSHTQIHYIIRESTREKERTSHSLYIYNGIHTLNPNDGASLFIKKTRVTSHKITKLLLTHSPSFIGYEAFRLDRVSIMHL